jgi:hypothetical protein
VRATVVSRSSLRVLSGTSLSGFRLRLMLDLKRTRGKRLAERVVSPSRKLATSRRRFRRRRFFRTRRFWSGRPPFAGYALSLASRNPRRKRNKRGLRGVTLGRLRALRSRRKISPFKLLSKRPAKSAHPLLANQSRRPRHGAHGSPKS